MHPNPVFRKSGQNAALAFAKQRGFGTLSINGDAGPLAAHIPFIVSKDSRKAMFHLLRSNPIARIGHNAKAVLIINGPNGYISPDWYGTEQQVPTWNYVAVHLRGTLNILPDDALETHLRALSDHFEKQLFPKPVWLFDKVDLANRAKMMRMIVPAEICISDIDSTWKLNQNKTAPVRLAAANALEESPIGTLQNELAQLMRDQTSGN